MLLALWIAALAHDPAQGHLDSEVVVWLPVPVARPTPGEVSLCVVVAPTLGTDHTVLETEGVAVSCRSTEADTTLCVTVSAEAAWPARIGRMTCLGEGHVLRATFVPGHDPHDDPADGVEVVRMRGPEALKRDRTVSFVVAGWPDASGTLEDGHCEVRGERLTLIFQESWRNRMTCRLAAPLSRDVAIRLRRPRRTATDR